MPPPTRSIVKICGLSTPHTVAAALSEGADRLGFVFFPPSPRHVEIASAAALARPARGVADIVALTVDADDTVLDAIVAGLEPDWLQLHGAETPERVVAIRSRFGLRVMKAVGVTTAADLDNAERYRGAADAILFDAKPPRGAPLPGGNGVPFDWTILKSQEPGFMLSGGLTPTNVTEAMRVTGARAVDVSSGVERAPGIKDPAAIRAFIVAVKGAALA